MTIPHVAIDTALQLLPARMDSAKARVMLYAIGLQESRFEHRRQVVDGGGKGPATGFWQFERAGGVKGVIQHPSSRYWAHDLCETQRVQCDPHSVWAALERDDVLAAGFARLLLFTDPLPLPAIDDVNGAWKLYARTWRPGKPHPEFWAANHLRAAKALEVAA